LPQPSGAIGWEERDPAAVASFTRKSPMPTLLHELERLAAATAERARLSGLRIVLAESCTAGLVAQSLSRVPGASDWFCGSAVVYRNATKTAWLQVSAALLDAPEIGPVSAETAAAMTAGVLRMTPEATFAASVTGHLGPHAPPHLDGVVYVGLESRSLLTDSTPAGSRCSVDRLRLPDQLPADSGFTSLRDYRQHWAALAVLRRLAGLPTAASPE